MPRARSIFKKRHFRGNRYVSVENWASSGNENEPVGLSANMLITEKRGSKLLSYSPEQLNNALKAIRIDKRKIREVGRSFRIPESTLRKYLKSNELPLKPFGRRPIVLKNESSDSSVYIKQEVMEPVIEMLEGAPDMKDPFTDFYLDSNIYKYYNEDLITNRTQSLNEPEGEIAVPETCRERIKAEPLDIIDEQTIAKRCQECDEYFEEIWDLQHHLYEKHSKNESTKILTETLEESPPTPTASPSLLKAVLVSSLTDFTSRTTITCGSSTSAPTNQMNGTIQSVPPSSLITPTSLTTIDSSKTFVISLAPFPKSKRVKIKEKILQFVETLLKEEVES